MTTICADELLHEAGDVRENRTQRRTPARPRPAAEARPATGRARTPATRKRFEDFEARTSSLGDLLGGQIFPRVF